MAGAKLKTVKKRNFDALFLRVEEECIFRYGNTNSLGFGRNSDLPPERYFPHLMKPIFHFPVP